MSESQTIPSNELDAELAQLLQPFDDHNQELLGHVHPPDWVNPEPAKRYHLVVIGAGTAGLVSAAGAAGLGARVALVERRLMGGDCLNYGCVPSKGVIRAARAWHEAAQGAKLFGAPQIKDGGDFGRAMARMRKLRAQISKVDSAARFRDLGIDVFLGDGRFVASDAIEVNGKRLNFRRAVVATGARPVAPPIKGLAESGYLDNESIFTLSELPPRLAIIGGGPIGCEMSQSFSRLGSEVTLLDMAPHVLIREDSDAAAIVQEATIRGGVRLELGVKILEVRNEGNEKVISFSRNDHQLEVRADQLLVAAGRAPNVEGMGLEAAGIDFDTRKGVAVNDRLRTSNKRVYACGDVASLYKFTHMADAQARIVIQNALFFGRKKSSDLVLPWCTYTSPEIAHVGLYEKEAKDRGIEVETLTIPLDDVDRAILDGEDEGFLRLHLKKGSDKILGATLVAEHAGEMLGELCLAVTHGIGLGKIATTIHPYPTQGEVIKKAGDAFNRGRLTSTLKKIFETYFRFLS